MIYICDIYPPSVGEYMQVVLYHQQNLDPLAVQASVQLRKGAWLSPPSAFPSSVGLAATELWRRISEGKWEKDGIESFLLAFSI